LEPTADILAGLASRRRESQTLIGFAAEVGDGIERARQKLSRKRVDAIVFNDVSRPEIGFDSGDNEVLILDTEGEILVPQASKAAVAAAILDRVDQIRARPSHSPSGPERFRSH